MNMNYQNSAKRTIAGILAALSLISCTALPAVTAGAEEAAEPEIIKTMTAAVETEEDTAVMATEPETEAETEAETQPVSVADRSEAEKFFKIS